MLWSLAGSKLDIVDLLFTILVMINASQVHQTEMDIVHTSAHDHGESAMHKAKRQGQQVQCKHAYAMRQP